ncbi:MAG: hypothetical protein DDT19_02191 [Syntrophomonadaceae bacterium]|nr:hypothetical protein [Bacillota bacterium]
MSKIQLSKISGYIPIPEGRYIFRIVKCTYDKDFGKLEIDLVTANGYRHTERFTLLGQDGEINEKAQAAFTFFARTALDDYNLEEVDHLDLVGCYLKCDVEHQVLPSKREPGKTVTFTRLVNKEPARGFTEHNKKPVEKGKPNFDDLLG